MTTSPYQESDLLIPPGFTLKEELEARQLTQRELARQMGRPVQLVQDIVHGRRSITPETALQLEQVLDIPAYLWLRLEAAYRLGLARQRAATRSA